MANALVYTRSTNCHASAQQLPTRRPGITTTGFTV